MSTKKSVRACPICDSHDATILQHQQFAESSESGSASEVDILSCDRCGCGFSDLNVVQSDLDRAYEENSKYADMSVFGTVSSEEPKLNESPWDLERLTSTASWIANAAGKRDLRVLDAGCATGTLIGMLQEQGFTNLVGLDPSPLAAATARKHYKVEAHAGSFCSPPANVGKFDLIVLSHVLEHIADVKAAADGLASLVEVGGLVYLEVPDATRYPEFLVGPFHDFNNEHVNHFSLNCLDLLLKRRGFQRVSGGSKEVPIAPSILYPAAFGLWRKTSNVEEGIEFDEKLRASLLAYVVKSRELVERLDHWFEDKIADEQLALWGAGNLTLKMLASTSLAKKNVRHIVDGSTQRQGVTISGISVDKPDVLRGFEGTVIVMSLHHAESIFNAAAQLMGPSQRILKLLS